MKRIFLIDDDVDDREMFQLALDTLPGEILLNCAANGEIALQLIADAAFIQPDFIFLDLNMPKMGGLDFLVELRKQQLCADVPVYIYTTSFVGRDVDRCLELGGRLCIKHSSFADLCLELERLVGSPHF